MRIKGLFSILFGLVLLGLVSSRVEASEGIFELGSVNNSGSSCYVLSVLIDGRYQVLGTCRNLKVPYTAELNRYVMWIRDREDNVIRLGEIRHGKIEESISEGFNSIMVTAEGGSQPRRPSESVVAQGSVKGIPSLGEATPGDEEVTPTPTPVEDDDEDPGERGSLTRFLATLGRIVGIGFLILLIAVVVMTIVTRRKERI